MPLHDSFNDAAAANTSLRAAKNRHFTGRGQGLPLQGRQWENDWSQVGTWNEATGSIEGRVKGVNQAYGPAVRRRGHPFSYQALPLVRPATVGAPPA